MRKRNRFLMDGQLGRTCDERMGVSILDERIGIHKKRMPREGEWLQQVR